MTPGEKPTAQLPSGESGFAEIGRILGSRALRMVMVLLLLWLGLGINPDTRDAFLTAGNFSNLTAQVAEIVIIGVGMTLVIIIGGIDLSVGALMALCGVVAAKLQFDRHQSAVVAIGCALAVGALIGLWHGMLVARLRIPAFIATLAGFMAYRGLGVVIAEGHGISPMQSDFLVLGSRLSFRTSAVLCVIGFSIGMLLVIRRETRRRQFKLPAESAVLLALRAFATAAVTAAAIFIYQDGMPVPVLIAALATALGAVILRRSRLGRYAFAIGGNAEAARLSGVPVPRVTMSIYMLLGSLTALAGMVAAARTNGVTPGNMGGSRELHVISAVVIGGTSLSGGSGTMLGTVVGALVFGTLSNGMNMMNIDSNWQNVFTGLILLGAAFLDSLSSQKRSK